MAITAWSAKVVTRSTSRSLNGSTRQRASAMTPIGSPSRNNGTPMMECRRAMAACSFIA